MVWLYGALIVVGLFLIGYPELKIRRTEDQNRVKSLREVQKYGVKILALVVIVLFLKSL